jgi:hypothetical protein
MGKASRRRKSLALKVQHLRLEIEDREEEMRSAEEEFLKEISSIDCEELVKKSPPPPAPPQVVSNASSVPDEVLEIDKAPEGPEEMKSLWRSIAIATHPDKTGGDPEKDDLYKRANEAWKKGEYSKLVQIALELGIDPPDTESSLSLLEEMTHDLEKKLKETEKSVLWEWSKAPPEAKKRIIDLYLLSKGKKRKEV